MYCCKKKKKFQLSSLPLGSVFVHPSCPLPPSHIPPHSSCSWVIHMSSLASTFPILFLPSPCLFSTYHLCYLFYVPFPALYPHPTPLLITLHVILFLFWLFAQFFLKYILLIMLLYLSHFLPFTPLHLAHLLPPTFPPYSSCPWVMHISSLASTFPILF